MRRHGKSMFDIVIIDEYLSLHSSVYETLLKELEINGSFIDYNTVLIDNSVETMASKFSKYVKYRRAPEKHEWYYFFMCESIEDKAMQEQIKKCYNEQHQVGVKLHQPCNPNFKKESWRK